MERTEHYMELICTGPLKMSHCGHLIENSDTEESLIIVKSIYDE